MVRNRKKEAHLPECLVLQMWALQREWEDEEA